MSESRLHLWDFVAIGLYFSALVGTSLYAMCKNKRDTVKGYFLAGRFMTWLPVGASLFASNIGSEHFIGLAGSGAASGIAVGAFELNSCFLLQVLGWLFLPVYISSGVCTLPEYMKKRFGGQRIRIYLAVLSLSLYIFTKISVNLYSGALFIQQAFSWNLYVSVLILLSITALTTVTGGLAAVIYTDTLQSIVMISGAFLLTILGFIKVGGYSTLYHSYMTAVASSSRHHHNFNQTFNEHSNVNKSVGDVTSSSLLIDVTTTNSYLEYYHDRYNDSSYNYADATNMAKCGQPRPDSWYMLRSPFDKQMPWPGFLFGQTTVSLWYWCADQMIVQRTLASKSLSHAQGSTLLAGYMKILPVFILVLPGMISRVLYTDEVACNDAVVCMEVCQNPSGCSNIAFPKLVLEIMPTGLKGIMISVMLAALVGEMTSIFNSASTLFTMDVYRTIRKKTHNRELMIVGRLFVCVMVVVGILWIPIVQSMQGDQLYIYIQSVSAYLAPPIAAVFLLAILWTRANEQGAFWGLMVGLFLGSIRMIANFIYHEPGCGQNDDRPLIISHLHYMYFAFILFVCTNIVVVVVSLSTKKPEPHQIIRTTFWTRFQQDKEYTASYDDLINLQLINKDSKDSVVYPIGAKQNGVSYFGNQHHVTSSKFSDADILSTCDKIDSVRKAPEVDNDDCNDDNIGAGNNAKANDLDGGINDNDDGVTDDDDDVTDGDGVGCDKEIASSTLPCRFFDWFCGLSPENDTVKNKNNLSCHKNADNFDDVENNTCNGDKASIKMSVNKLYQSKREKRILRVFLILLLCTTIFFYVFFSTGSDFGLLRNELV